MPGVFDRLNEEIQDKQKEGGITPLDLADLPPALRKIMRLMLRELQMNYPRLREVMESMPEAERLSRDELDAALSSLTEQFWLIRIGTGEKAIYKVNLRRKEGSKLAAGLWTKLDERLKRKPGET
ncbi:MAG: hypothetical protein KJZ77_03000 [Anaerolineales bacterium]|nr:hypothetical protein [Anaerolineales bacterium]